MKKFLLIIIFILTFINTVSCEKKTEEIEEILEKSTENSTIDREYMLSLFEDQIGYMMDFDYGSSKYDYMEPVIKNFSELTHINNDRANIKSEKIYVNAHVTNEDFIICRDLRYDEKENDTVYYGMCKIYNDEKKERICVDDDCRKNLLIPCSHMQILNILDIYIYINNTIYIPIRQFTVIEGVPFNFNYILKYDLSKNELYKYWEISESSYYLKNMFLIGDYLYAVETNNITNLDIEAHVIVTRINTTDDTACELYNKKSTDSQGETVPLFPLGKVSFYKNNLVFIMGTTLFLSNYDLTEYTVINLYSESQASIKQYNFYYNNIYYTIDEWNHTRNSNILYRYTLDTNKITNLKNDIEKFFIYENHIYYSEYNLTPSYDHQVHVISTQGPSRINRIETNTLNSNSKIYRAPINQNGYIEFDKQNLVVKAPVEKWFENDIIFVKNNLLYLILLSQGDLNNIYCHYDLIRYDLKELDNQSELVGNDYFTVYEELLGVYVGGFSPTFKGE